MRRVPIAILIVLVAATAARAGSLTLTSPNGGEQITLGSTVSITWTASAPAGKKVKLILLQDEKRIGEIATGIPAAAGSYAWKVGEISGDGSALMGGGYRVRVKVIGGNAEDTSDTGFSIRPSLLMSGIQTGASSSAKAKTDTPVLSATSPDSSRTARTPEAGKASAGLSATSAVHAAGLQAVPLTLFVTNPRAGDRWAEGETRLVSWTTNARGLYTIELWDSLGMKKLGGIVDRQPEMSQDGEYQYRWAIPADAVGHSGDVTLRVSMGEASALSGTFHLENHLAMANKTYEVQATTGPGVTYDMNHDGETFMMGTAHPHPQPGQLIVGVDNHWHDGDNWRYHLYRSHAFADLSAFKGKGLLVAARLRFHRIGDGGCDPLPLVRSLDTPWDGNPDHLNALPTTTVNPENLLQSVTKWIARPAENHGLVIHSSREADPLPWHTSRDCVSYYDGVHLELEFVEKAD